MNALPLVAAFVGNLLRCLKQGFTAAGVAHWRRSPLPSCFTRRLAIVGVIQVFSRVNSSVSMRPPAHFRGPLSRRGIASLLVAVRSDRPLTIPSCLFFRVILLVSTDADPKLSRCEPNLKSGHSLIKGRNVVCLSYS